MKTVKMKGGKQPNEKRSTLPVQRRRNSNFDPNYLHLAPTPSQANVLMRSILKLCSAPHVHPKQARLNLTCTK